MKRILTILGGALLLCSTDAAAQTNRPAPSPTPETRREATPEEIKNADLVITANVRARELRFEVVPNPTVEFPGKPERKTVWEDDRQNLPRPIEPGVTYRNIGIQLRIVSRFADIERIVAEALGEIPVTDDAPTTPAPQPTIEIQISQLPIEPVAPPNNQARRQTANSAPRTARRHRPRARQ